MNIFNFIKARVSILDVVNEYATLKKAGTYYKGRCPFHHEKTGSFTVSPHKEIFYCFGCHLGGDVISFISKVENCSQLDAAKHLVERYNLELPPDITFDKSGKSHKQYNEICQFVALWAHEQLKKNPAIIRYLQERGFSTKSMKYFTVGYFPGGLQSIKQLIYSMKQHNILVKDLLEANILTEGKTVMYSPFEDRIIFPIKDHLGRFCGFGGRIYKQHDTRPKYYNSRENEFFNKGSILFGLDLAKKYIQKRERAYLVEGYTDCVAMVQNKYPNTIATLGTACTLAHLKLLARYANQLYILYDSDNAGKKAILRLTDLCWQANIEPYVICLPDNEDPASYLKKGGDLPSLINKAQDIFNFFIDSLGSTFSSESLNKKMQVARKLIKTIHGIQDPLKKDILLQKAASTLAIPATTLKQEMEQLSFKPENDGAPEKKSDTNAPNVPDSAPMLEKQIFCAIMNDIQLLKNTNEKYLIDYMVSPLRDILHQLKQLKQHNSNATFVQLFDILSDEHKQYVSKLLIEHGHQIEAQAFEQLLVQLQKKRWKTIAHTLKQQLAQAKRMGDDNKVQEILHDFLELKQKLLPRMRHD